jgi:hypothetical protein
MTEMRRVEFHAGSFLARLFLTLEPIIGLARAQRVMVWLITHRPFYKRDVPR